MGVETSRSEQSPSLAWLVLTCGRWGILNLLPPFFIKEWTTLANSVNNQLIPIQPVPVSPERLPEVMRDLVHKKVSLRFIEYVPTDGRSGLAPFYHFRIIADGCGEVGHINFRVGTSEHVQLCAGHIGYAVDEKFRGHRYALQACRALAPFARSFYREVILTCNPDNHASIKTIELLGATFIDEIAVPKHDPGYAKGARRKRRYRWQP